jgi:hypothetical protein
MKMITLVNDTEETPIKEITLQQPPTISIDEILKGYDKPMEITATPTDAKLPEGQKPVVNIQPSAFNNPNTHYPDGRPKEYFVRGAKRGQEKPYRPIYNNPHQPPVNTIITSTTPPPAQMPGSSVLTGAMFLVLVDMLFPMLLEIGNNFIDPKHKISAKQLKLQPEQRKELEPLADMIMKQINFQGSPVLLLSLGLFGTYALNFMALKAAQK